MTKYILLSILLLLSCNCEEEEINELNIELFAEYENKINGQPTLTIDNSKIPEIVILNNVPTLSSNCQNSRVCLTLSNVRFLQNGSAYEVLTEKSQTFEENSGSYIKDIENELITSKSRSLDFVLVLDISNSLGLDEPKVKQYAKEFIDKINLDLPNSKVGIVVFSDKIESLPLGNDYNAAKNFIDNKSGANETKLFEAINIGLDLLNNSTADGIALLTFTDGINNSWSDPLKFQTNNFILNRLKQPINGIKVSSFCIGLAGATPTGALTSQLNELSLNGGFTEVAENSSVLQTTFTKFASSVSSVYNLTYNRNNSFTSTPINLKFNLVLRKL